MDRSSLGLRTNSQEEYLVHFGVKGMKWGVRRKSFTGTDFSYGDAKTRWGANRKRASDHNKAIKETYKKAKADVKAGKLKKDSKRYKDARVKNLAGRAAATATGHTKSQQGRYYAHRASGKSTVEAAALTFANRTLKGMAAQAAIYQGGMTVTRLIGKSMRRR